MLGCAPISDTDKDPTPPVNPTISFSSVAVASSLQLEISSNVELPNIRAVVRLAAEAAPTKAEALASKGHVSVRIPADVTRKISISQHYTTNLDDGLTFADVLAPNTAYKLYLYFPAELITTTAEITGLNVTNDMAAVPFTTAALPAEGDAKWLNSNGNSYVASLDNLYFMQEQTGIAVFYFYTNFAPLISEFSIQDENGTFNGIGIYAGNIVTPDSNFHFAYGSISGYISNSTNRYNYWIGADKVKIIKNSTRHTLTDGPTGIDLGVVFIPVTRH
ncbi:hypothetical protein P0082_08235 [Candidatus Haliotispira prima]|uniref:DUF4382 domain-containing protein n=1 Tax=Candidatus Haliotispira prima TaxID=3034016 RepID=A0ABY8MER3_9SPIO|nr:hypothetical protein P0082_08235 [Candidatus Haliotispira prima]